MEAVKYYELRIANNVFPSNYVPLQFSTTLEVKLFMKKIRNITATNAGVTFKLYEVVGTWNMESGGITFTTTQVTSL